MKVKLNIKSIATMALIAVTTSMLFINISFAANTGKVTETSRLREQASTDSKVLELVNQGEEVEVLGEENSWYKIKHNNLTGYLRKDLVQMSGTNAANNTTEEKDNNENTTENTVTNTETNTTGNTETQNETNTENTTANVETQNQTTNAETNNTETNTENSNAETASDSIEENKTYKLKENVKPKVIPLISSIELEEVKKDTNLEVTEVLDDWVKVKISDVQQGWIRKDKLQTEKEKAEEEAKAKAQAEAEAKRVADANLQVTSRSGQTTREKQTAAKAVTNTAKTTSTAKNTTNKTQNTSSKTKSTTTNTTKANTAVVTESTSTSSSGSSVASYATQYVGSRYVSGGTSPSGFDCSGFTQYVYKHFGVSLNRTAAAQYSNGSSVSSLQAGDLVMFSFGKGISHVGIYIGGGQFVHAANSRQGVRIDSMNGSYKSHFVGARRIF